MTASVPPGPSVESQRLYGEHIRELDRRLLSGSENFDKSVLTLSSAGLGLSVAFLKDVIELRNAEFLWILYLSWFAFIAAIISTLVSFLASAKAHEFQKQQAERFYLLGEDRAADEPVRYDELTKWLNRTSCAAFVLALVLTPLFVIANLELNEMTNPKAPPQGSLEQKGAPLPTLQRPVSAPAPVPAPSPTPSSPAPGN